MKEKAGTKDIITALKNVYLPVYLANSDIRQRYRRSTLGPFWITISTGVMIACIGLIFGNLFKSPMQEFLPFLSVGLILWSFISSVITESTNVFVSYQGIIKQLPIPLFSHIIRMTTRNLIILFHNLLILPIVYFVVHKSIDFEFFLVIPGLIILIINLLWIGVILSLICTRFRDLTQIVLSLLQVAFYVTPIIWMPSLLPARTDVMILAPNPFYHLIGIVRSPLLGSCPTIINWIYSVIFAILGWIFAIYLYNKYKNRIAYWL